MTTPLRCLITGCEFLDTTNNRWIHGDLHQLLECLIFNADGCKWNDMTEKPLSEGAMVIKADCFYERNNQIVFPLQEALFNDFANQYLTEMLNKRDEAVMIMVLDAMGLKK